MHMRIHFQKCSSTKTFELKLLNYVSLLASFHLQTFSTEGINEVNGLEPFYLQADKLN